MGFPLEFCVTQACVLSMRHQWSYQNYLGPSIGLPPSRLYWTFTQESVFVDSIPPESAWFGTAYCDWKGLVLVIRMSFLDLPTVRMKKEPVRVGGTRALRYLSLAPSEIVCESDLRPEIGFNCPKLEEEERFRYSNRRAAGLQISNFKDQGYYFSSLHFCCFYHDPQSHVWWYYYSTNTRKNQWKWRQIAG